MCVNGVIFKGVKLFSFHHTITITKEVDLVTYKHFNIHIKLICKNCSFPLEMVLRFLQASMGRRKMRKHILILGLDLDSKITINLFRQMHKKESDPKSLLFGGAMQNYYYDFHVHVFVTHPQAPC
jgi:hypothetical protein